MKQIVCDICKKTTKYGSEEMKETWIHIEMKLFPYYEEGSSMHEMDVCGNKCLGSLIMRKP